jgi:galactokinase
MPTAELIARARETFAHHFGGEPTVVARAPGRVELLGNHTDYNGGLVMASAIDRDTVVVGRPIAGRAALVHSVAFDAPDTFLVDRIEKTEPAAWTRYVRGVCWALTERFGPLASGFEAVFAGDVPLGGGLSSSASLQAAWARFLIGAGLVPRTGSLAGLDSDEPAAHDRARMDVAQALRRSENVFVEVGSGLLDQFSALFGVADHALTLDCLSLEHGAVPLGTPAPALVVCDSGTSRRLADGMYDRRVAECKTVVDYFRGRLAPPEQGPMLLRHIPLAELEDHWDALDPVGRRRARHVLTENERVRQGVVTLCQGDLRGFGQLISASHASSRDDFANSSRALDALVEAAQEASGFLGGKLSGAGWAGCTVNLVEADKAADFGSAVRAGYERRTGLAAAVHICHAADGASAQIVA